MQTFNLRVYAYTTAVTDHQNSNPVLYGRFTFNPETLSSQLESAARTAVLEAKAAIWREIVYRSNAGSDIQVAIEIDGQMVIDRVLIPEINKNASVKDVTKHISDALSGFFNALCLKLYRLILSSPKFRNMSLEDPDNI